MNGADVVGHPATPAEAQLAVTGFESLDVWAYGCKVRRLETNRSAEEPPEEWRYDHESQFGLSLS